MKMTHWTLQLQVAALFLVLLSNTSDASSSENLATKKAESMRDRPESSKTFEKQHASKYPALNSCCAATRRRLKLSNSRSSSPATIDRSSYNEFGGRRSNGPSYVGRHSDNHVQWHRAPSNDPFSWLSGGIKQGNMELQYGIYKKLNDMIHGLPFESDLVGGERASGNHEMTKKPTRVKQPRNYAWQTDDKWPYMFPTNSPLHAYVQRLFPRPLQHSAKIPRNNDGLSNADASYSLENRIHPVKLTRPTSKFDDSSSDEDDVSLSSEELTEDEALPIGIKLPSKSIGITRPYLNDKFWSKINKIPEISIPTHFNDNSGKMHSWSGTSADGRDSWNINIMKLDNPSQGPNKKNR